MWRFLYVPHLWLGLCNALSSCNATSTAPLQGEGEGCQLPIMHMLLYAHAPAITVRTTVR